MDPKMSEVIDRLIAAADRVGMEGARLWPDVVGITFLQHTFWLAWGVLGGAAVWLGVVLLCRWMFKDAAACHARDKEAGKTEQGGYEDPYKYAVGLSIPLVAVALIWTIVVVADAPKNLAGIFYPEAKTVLDLAAKLR